MTAVLEMEYITYQYEYVMLHRLRKVYNQHPECNPMFCAYILCDNHMICFFFSTALITRSHILLIKRDVRQAKARYQSSCNGSHADFLGIVSPTSAEDCTPI